MKATVKRLLCGVVYLGLAIYAYFGGRCPAEGCPACRWFGK